MHAKTGHTTIHLGRSPLRALRDLLRRIFPAHEWVENEVAGITYRTCALTGERQVYEFDDWGCYWVPVPTES